MDKLSDMFGIPKDQASAYFSSLELGSSSNMVIGILEQIQHIVQSEMQSICFCESEDGSWRPSSVKLGLKMSQEKKNLVCTLSKVAGIPRIYECYAENGELKWKMLG